MCAVTIPAALVAGCGGGVPGNAVATVDDNDITKASFTHWLDVAAKSGGQQAKALADAVVSANKGELTGPILTQIG